MNGHKWTKASRAKLSQTMKARFAVKKVKEMTPKQVADELTRLAPPVGQDQQLAVDLDRLERFNYRRGLLDAVEFILRELRHA